MKANIENIQKIYSEIPNTWLVENIRIDNYKLIENHFEHGWRDVIIPEITEIQKLGNEYILVNDIVTKEVIDLTQLEISELNKSKVPTKISRMKFKMQIRRSTNYTYEIIVEYIENMVVTSTFTLEMKQDILDRLNDCVELERYSSDFIMLANMMGVSDAKKDEIFIEGNKIN